MHHINDMALSEEMLDEILESIPVKRRLAGLSPSQQLAGLTMEDILYGLSLGQRKILFGLLLEEACYNAEEWFAKEQAPSFRDMEGYDELVLKLLEGLPIEERLVGLSIEQIVAGLSPEQLLAGLSLEQRLMGLSPEQRDTMLALLDAELGD